MASVISSLFSQQFQLFIFSPDPFIVDRWTKYHTYRLEADCGALKEDGRRAAPQQPHLGLFQQVMERKTQLRHTLSDLCTTTVTYYKIKPSTPG